MRRALCSPTELSIRVLSDRVGFAAQGFINKFHTIANGSIFLEPLSFSRKHTKEMLRRTRASSEEEKRRSTITSSAI